MYYLLLSHCNSGGTNAPECYSIRTLAVMSCVFSHTVYKSQNILTPWCTVLLEKLTGLQLVKKFPTFHGTRKFITALTSVRQTVSILGQPNAVHIPTSYLLEIHLNNIHPSTPRSPQCSLLLRFPHQDPIHPTFLTHTGHMASPSHSSRFYHPHNMQSPPFPRYLVPPRS